MIVKSHQNRIEFVTRTESISASTASETGGVPPPITPQQPMGSTISATPQQQQPQPVVRMPVSGAQPQQGNPNMGQTVMAPSMGQLGGQMGPRQPAPMVTQPGGQMMVRAPPQPPQQLRGPRPLQQQQQQSLPPGAAPINPTQGGASGPGQPQHPNNQQGGQQVLNLPTVPVPEASLTRPPMRPNAPAVSYFYFLRYFTTAYSFITFLKYLAFFGRFSSTIANSELVKP